MRRSTLTREDFSICQRVAGFEGGTVYSAEQGEKFYLIQDESTMAEFLSDEDLFELKDDLVKTLEFDSRQERDAYLSARGLVNRPHHSS
jgi:hypothetical protein